MKNLETVGAVHTHARTHTGGLENKIKKYKKGRVIGPCGYIDTG